MRQVKGWLAGGVALCALAGTVRADEQSNEDRLRDALRQSVQEMRAAQDVAAQAQADLAKANADKADLQKQLDAATAKLADLAGKSTAKPADLAALQAQLAAARAQIADTQGALAKWQGDDQNARQIAQAKANEAAAALGGLKANTAALDTCKATNAKLIDVAEDVLHLYESQSFRSILLRSYEPLIGTAKVKLQNMVQDYDDKIIAQEYVAPKGLVK